MSDRAPEDFEAVLDSDNREMAQVTELTMYPSDFPILLKRRLQGCSVAEAAGLLDVPKKPAGKI